MVDLSSFLLTLLSLHPGMLENGLDEASCVVPSDTPPSLSPDPMPYPGPPEEEPAAADQGVAEATDSEEQPAADEDMKDNAQMANFAKIAQIPIETFGLPLKVRLFSLPYSSGSIFYKPAKCQW